ncbi:hypothetical protein BKA70DRAFT_1258512, partial [Coprinopsis sp. MPI-PUGE-AT-0042]
MDALFLILKDNLTSYVSAILVLSAAACYFQRRRIGRTLGGTANDNDSTRVPETKVMRGSNFTYPKIEPRIQSFTKVKEIPYRPFRPGAYHVNMGIRSMPWDDWIEPHSSSTINTSGITPIRKHRIETRGDKLIRVLRDDHNPQVRGGALA